MFRQLPKVYSDSLAGNKVYFNESTNELRVIHVNSVAPFSNWIDLDLPITVFYNGVSFKRVPLEVIDEMVYLRGNKSLDF